MEETITRKCSACKQPITVDPCDINGVVCYQKLYYHTSCFCELAEKRSKTKRSKAEEWKYALENLAELEGYARAAIMANLKKPKKERPKVRKPTDDLNEYLLTHYNVHAVSNANFWRMVMELQKGIYRGKRCKKVSIETLLEAWKWAQKKLDDINKRNKANHKGPEDDELRIPYDFAILVGKIPNYLSYKAKQDAQQAEIKTQMPRINYASLQRTTIQDDGLDDISYLLEDDDD